MDVPGAKRASPRHGRSRFFTRRKCLAAFVVLALLPGGCQFFFRKIGGDFRGPPSEMWSALSPGARALIARAHEGIDPDTLADFHVHVVGLGKGGSGIYLNPDWLSIWHPFKRARTEVYISASGIDVTSETADREYIVRFAELARAVAGHGKYHLLAFDYHYRPDGTRDLERTSFAVPNEYVVSLAEEFPDVFVPVVSVHPYRLDALDALEKWARNGCRFVKWLPNAMGIDPSNDRTLPFYEKMKALDMVLLCHTGHELSVDAEHQDLGNPLLLRTALDAGVTVVAFHAGSRGEYVDLDDPEKRHASALDLFFRLMDDPRYEGRLFGEISATTFSINLDAPLRRILEREDLQHRFVNGSDYPLPAINVVTRTGKLASLGFITDEERSQLDEIYGYNPLLFDFVLKRTLRHPESGKRLRPTVFQVPPELRRPWPPVTRPVKR